MSYDDAFEIAYDYTVRFYPRWYTWTQLNIISLNLQRGTLITNRLSGPYGMGPEYKIVVAINDDTVYAQTFLDVSQGPQILTLPSYKYSYSILQLDVYGNVFATNLSSNPPTEETSFALCLAGSGHQHPQGTVRVEIPYPLTILIIRIDKYSSSGENLIDGANQFRANMYLQSVDEFASGATGIEGGQTFIGPLYNYAPSVKAMADSGLTFAPEAFLASLKEAMASPMTQPISGDDQQLIQRFNDFFDAARTTTATDGRLMSAICAGAKAAHVALINRWLSHRNENNWIHFDNVGEWGTSYLDRAALTQYIQYGNNAAAAFYADAFVDGTGLPLDGTDFAYTITFDRETMPRAKRFWSITAYTPETVELVPNPIDKYVVASYTPGLVEDDGTIVVLMQAEQPKIGPVANWLPVPKGPFSILLRIYGPEGRAADGTYVPPKIHRTVPR
jgi:hypothetical protein